MREAREGFFFTFFILKIAPQWPFPVIAGGLEAFTFTSMSSAHSLGDTLISGGSLVVVVIELQYCCSWLQTGEMFLLNWSYELLIRIVVLLGYSQLIITHFKRRRTVYTITVLFLQAGYIFNIWYMLCCFAFSNIDTLVPINSSKWQLMDIYNHSISVVKLFLKPLW